MFHGLGRTIICKNCRNEISVSQNARTDVWCPWCRRITPLFPKDESKFIRQVTSVWDFYSKMRSKVRSCSSIQRQLSGPSPSTSYSYGRLQRKRALLCGITYKNCKYRLMGTVNDVRNMSRFLIDHFGFSLENIRVLTEEQNDPAFIPTKKNMEAALSWLVDDCQNGDSLVFFYSGHGIRQLDLDNDEIDGFNEVICPVDFETEGFIVDNYINSTIVRPLKTGVTLHAIIDACHSGTVLDLEYVYSRQLRKWKTNKPPSGAHKGTNGGLAICISACEDEQVASDTSAFAPGDGSMNGAMTFLLIQVVVKSYLESGITYGDLLDKVFKRIEEVNQQGCFTSSKILRKLSRSGITQKPLLSSSEQFDVYRRRFTL